MGRHKRSLVVVGLVLLVAALAPAAGARKPHKKKKPEPKPLSFRVTWTVTRGTWNMDYDCHCDHASYGGVHTLKEHDLGLQFEATYNDVKIAAKDMTPAITADASSWSAKGDFSMNENVWTETDPDYLIDCNGKFAKGGPAPVLSAGSGYLDSHFLVEAMKTFKIDGVTGSNCPGLAHYHPFWPISVISPDKTIPPPRFIEDMMTAPAKVDLSLLRHMKVGDVAGITEHHGTRLPPEDCGFAAPSGSTCTESFEFTGHLRFERTG